MYKYENNKIVGSTYYVSIAECIIVENEKFIYLVINIDDHDNDIILLSQLHLQTNS